MKKIITLSFVCAIISAMLSSCGSGDSITKRRYNKGYYISHDKNIEALVPIEKQEQNIAETVVNENNITTVENESIVQEQLSDDKTASSEKKDIDSDKKLSNRTEKTLTSLTSNFKNPVSQIKQALQKIKKPNSAKAEGDGYSLFWIAVIVLLILWMLGYLGGLGSFIHLLLLVALILLILWLLRLI